MVRAPQSAPFCFRQLLTLTPPAPPGAIANLLKLFAPRPPLNHATPVDRPPQERKLPIITGVASFLSRIADAPPHDQDYTPAETREEKKKRKQEEKRARGLNLIEEKLKTWKPNELDESKRITKDAYKTLFVGRLSYSVTEKILRREFEQFGPIVSIRIVSEPSDPPKPRGYAFIEYAHERDLTIAYREADGMKIDGRRVVVDVERGRTVKGWKPRRLGGGLGGTRLGLAVAVMALLVGLEEDTAQEETTDVVRRLPQQEAAEAMDLKIEEAVTTPGEAGLLTTIDVAGTMTEEGAVGVMTTDEETDTTDEEAAAAVISNGAAVGVPPEAVGMVMMTGIPFPSIPLLHSLVFCNTLLLSAMSLSLDPVVILL
ncbi:hypothetical protein HDU83_004723 [Entophlyctis luteolus]|nr:hypothetical protein HDU83_004723 [Entophlyctis luteolus]